MEEMPQKPEFSQQPYHRMIVLCGPSGTGKTTIAHHLLENIPELKFSVSATTRAPRGAEVDTRDYYFFAPDQFSQAISDELFIEYQEVYSGLLYGTLHSEVERMWTAGQIPLMDIDVKGAMNIKRIFGKAVLTIFVHPVNLENLERRLRARQTDSEESIQRRLSRAQEEMNMSREFDAIVYNDHLDKAMEKTLQITYSFLLKSEKLSSI